MGVILGHNYGNFLQRNSPLGQLTTRITMVHLRQKDSQPLICRNIHHIDSANKKHSGINSLFLSHPSAAVKKKTQLVLSVIFTHPRGLPTEKSTTMTVGGVYSVVLLRTQKIDCISTDLSALSRFRVLR
jgi:hypothetical protein